MKLLAINFKKMAVLLLPTFLRTATIIEFIKTFMPPFTDLQNRFFVARNNNLYTLRHNGQVCHLRAVLNDAFPTRDKSFEITDSTMQGEWVYAWDEELTDKQLMIPDEGGRLIYSVEVLDNYADFVVRIPLNLKSDDNLNRIKSLVNTYKLLSKKAIYEYN